jgi:hypothetical protein
MAKIIGEERKESAWYQLGERYVALRGGLWQRGGGIGVMRRGAEHENRLISAAAAS